VAVTLVSGLWGMLLYERAEGKGGLAAVADAFYHTLQLLVMESPHLECNIPLLLHVGRFFGAIFFLALTGLAFARLFPDEWKYIKLRLPWTKNHIVICGLGDIGTRLAIEGRSNNKFVVAIEKSCPHSKRESMRKKHVLVLDGDATDVAQLKEARVHNAEFVVASCLDDGTNVAIAAQVGKLLKSAPARAEQLVCRALIANTDTRQLLYSRPELQAQPQYRVNFSDLDQHALVARKALGDFPLDFKPIRQQDDILVRLVLIGFESIGQSLALQAARIGHFANAVKYPKRLRLTVVEPQGQTLENFGNRYPGLREVCELDRVTVSHEHLLLDELVAIGKQPNALATFAFCCEEDEKNYRLAMELQSRINSSNAQILCHQKTHQSFAALLSDDFFTNQGSRIHAFGMVEDVVNWKNFLHEDQDKLARALHEDFLKKYPNQHPEWNELSEGLRDSNRQAADHIEVKLRALGYHSAKPESGKQPITSFEESDIELLAQMEHARWCAERFLAGWIYGPVTDRKNKINNCLVPWGELPESEKKKDPEQIAAIPEALRNVGLGIYR
jgi:hypothetical protein